jgi:hypothetical protein
VTMTSLMATPPVVFTVPLALQAAKAEVAPRTATAVIRDLPRKELVDILICVSIVWRTALESPVCSKALVDVVVPPTDPKNRSFYRVNDTGDSGKLLAIQHRHHCFRDNGSPLALETQTNQ